MNDLQKQFDAQGYLVVERLLSAQEVAGCVEEVERLHDVARDAGASQSGYFQVEPYANDASNDDGRPVLRKVEQTADLSDVFGRLSRHPKLVAIVEELLGPDLLLFRSTLMLKPAFHGSVHGFHQDTSYWPMRPPRLVTVSIALNDATPANGCFQIIPDSHRGEVQDMQQWGGITRRQDQGLTDRKDLDTSSAMHVPLRAGSALFFHSSIVHGSGPNESPHPRHTALYAYFAPDVRYVPAEGEPCQRVFPVVAGLNGQAEVTFTAESP
jgi:phytanoyl-CoA hydroxylase